MDYDQKLFNVTSFDEILDWELQPEKWLIDGFIPETGLHLLMGAGKVGKSWFAFQCAQGVASGGFVLGKIPVKKSKVLYISLDDSWQVLLQRAKTLNFTKTGNNILVIEEIDRRVNHDVLYSLDELLKQDTSIRFVIIDTIQLFFEESVCLNEYCMLDNNLKGLRDIAYLRNVSILLVHNTNKSGRNETFEFMERTLEKTGLTTACDTLIYLTKQRKERRASMFIIGRKIIEKEYTIRMDENCGWVLEGDKREVVEGDTQKLVADWIKNYGKGRPIDIYNGLKAAGYMGSSDTIRQTCHRMKNAGMLVNEKGLFMLYIPFRKPVTVSQPEYEECEALIPSVIANDVRLLPTPPVTPVTVSQPEYEECDT